MSPTNQEIQLRKTCELYAYLLKAQGKEIPEEIQDCADAYDYEYLVNCVTELSEALKTLDSDTYESIVNNTQSKKALELKHWWEMQQEADKLSKTLTQTCL
ncbi:MAG: hypothetical protein EP216_02905 [Epsilonproteobacteria bacterium]|nr:MAG: hypothetical protein EP216_02905 [Campylobacterota bacterium]